MGPRPRSSRPCLLQLQVVGALPVRHVEPRRPHRSRQVRGVDRDLVQPVRVSIAYLPSLISATAIGTDFRSTLAGLKLTLPEASGFP